MLLGNIIKPLSSIIPLSITFLQDSFIHSFIQCGLYGSDTFKIPQQPFIFFPQSLQKHWTEVSVHMPCYAHLPTAVCIDTQVI